MKKVFFITISLFFSLSVLSQEKLNTNDLIGYWVPNKESTKLFFWKDIHNVLQTQELSETSGKELQLISIDVQDKCILINTVFFENNWIVESKYVFINKNTIKCTVTGSGIDEIIYTKIK
jgi:hypothetical protein